MADEEFTATGVRIAHGLRSLTRAGQVLIRDGRLLLLTSYGSEIDSAPVHLVRAGRPRFTHRNGALATVNGHRYLLTPGEEQQSTGHGEFGAAAGALRDARASDKDGTGVEWARRFLDAVRMAGGHTARA